MTTFRLVFPLAALAMLAGCGSDAEYVPVSGVVEIDGKPVEGCSVVFTPIHESLEDDDAPESSHAKTGKDGRYTLKILGTGKEGCAVGKHRVILSTSADTDDIDRRTGELVGERVPKKYRDGTHQVTVKEGGTDSMDFKFKGIKGSTPSS